MLTRRSKQVKKEAFLLPLSLGRLPAEGVAQIKGVPSRLKVKKACVNLFLDLDHKCGLHFWLIFHSSYGDTDNQE